MAVDRREGVVEELLREQLAAVSWSQRIRSLLIMREDYRPRPRSRLAQEMCQYTSEKPSAVARVGSCDQHAPQTSSQPFPNSSSMMSERSVAPRRACDTWLTSIMNAEAA